MTRLNQAFATAVITLLCSLPAAAATVTQLNPYTHFANIPAGADLSSIKFEKAKLVKVATQIASTSDARYCAEAANRDPGGSARCPSTEIQSSSQAYEVTYSYRAQALASDEYGSNYFTFSVYLRPDELSPAARQAVSERKTGLAGLFDIATGRAPIPQVVVDEASSRFCEGNYIEGSWVRTDPNCEDKINTRTITAPSQYITVRVEPAESQSAVGSSRSTARR